MKQCVIYDLLAFYSMTFEDLVIPLIDFSLISISKLRYDAFDWQSSVFSLKTHSLFIFLRIRQWGLVDEHSKKVTYQVITSMIYLGMIFKKSQCD